MAPVGAESATKKFGGSLIYSIQKSNDSYENLNRSKIE